MISKKNEITKGGSIIYNSLTTNHLKAIHIKMWLAQLHFLANLLKKTTQHECSNHPKNFQHENYSHF